MKALQKISAEILNAHKTFHWFSDLLL